MAPTYYPDGTDEDVEQRGLIATESVQDGRTPLDKTIDRIGMGSYQWALLALCGFGWMADNMWLQSIAIILPRVQIHYDVSDKYIGSLSASMFAGMTFGAIGWGTCSDLLGRSTAFNATLFFTAVFGVLASFANSYFTLCTSVFLLGSAVGGSMPTDGTLLLEHMPKSKQYLVTALSFFFSLGSVLAAVVGLLVIPQHSCLVSQPCDTDTQNLGWKYLLVVLGLITMLMFVARMVLFRLHESPRYLVHAGRPLEAIESLQLISRFNGSQLTLELEDVIDHHPSPDAGDGPQSLHQSQPSHGHTSAKPSKGVAHDAAPGPSQMVRSARTNGNSAGNADGSAGPPLFTQYNAMNESDGPNQLSLASFGNLSAPPEPLEFSLLNGRRPTMRTPGPCTTAMRRASSLPLYVHAHHRRFRWRLPRWLWRPLHAWWERVMMVLAPEWIRTTLAMWAAWTSMSLAYTMFNVYLPKLLETHSRASPFGTLDRTEEQTLQASLWDLVIFTLGGCPGSILGAYLIEGKLGRKWSLSASTFVTALFCAVFAVADSTWIVRASSVGLNLSATTMYAVLYGWTPEIFGTKVRGTACGIASALSRIGGMIAPLLGGVLLAIGRAFPVFTSAVIFVVAGFSVLLVPEGDGGAQKQERTFLH